MERIPDKTERDDPPHRGGADQEVAYTRRTRLRGRGNVPRDKTQDIGYAIWKKRRRKKWTALKYDKLKIHTANDLGGFLRSPDGNETKNFLLPRFYFERERERLTPPTKHPTKFTRPLKTKRGGSNLPLPPERERERAGFSIKDSGAAEYPGRSSLLRGK